MTVSHHHNANRLSRWTVAVALMMATATFPDTANAISACKTDDGRTVYSQACLEEMQRKRQQETQSTGSNNAKPNSTDSKANRASAAKPINQPAIARTQPSAAVATTPSPLEPNRQSQSTITANPDNPAQAAPARRQLVKPAAPQTLSKQIDETPATPKTAPVKPRPKQPTTNGLNPIPLQPNIQAQQLPAKLSSPALTSPLATQLGNPMQTDRTSSSMAKPGCRFTTLVEQVRTGTSDALLACAPSQAQLDQQDTRPDAEGRTLLHWAVESGQLDMARHLLLQGADSDLPARADKGARPVHLAAKRGDLELLELLLDQPGALESTDYFKRTPLYWAIDAGQYEAALQLLAAGANPNAQDRIGKSVLMAAVSRKRPSMVAQLLQTGADPSQTNFKGQTVMHLAAAESPASIELLMRQGISLEAINLEGQTPLLYLASRDPKRYWRTIRALVEAGAKLDVEDNSQRSLLDYSLAHNHLPLFDLLLDQGLNSDDLRVEQLKGKRAFLQRLLDRGLL